MCFKKPGAWLPAQRSANSHRRDRAPPAPLAPNRDSGSCLQPQPRHLPRNGAHSEGRAARRTSPRFSPAGPSGRRGEQEGLPGSGRRSAAAASAAEPRAPQPPARCAPPGPRRRPEPSLPSAPAPCAACSAPTRASASEEKKKNKIKTFAAYDSQFQRLANGVQTSASSE